MANIDKVSVKNTVYNIVSPAVVSDYIEVIGGACTKPDGYEEDEVILAKQNDVQLLFKATQDIAFGANIVENTNCVRTTLEEVLKNAGGGGGASSADQVSYDNSDSGLEAENVQEAVDELATNAGTASSQIQTLTNNLSDEVETRARLGVHNLLPNQVSTTTGNVTGVTLNANGTVTIAPRTNIPSGDFYFSVRGTEDFFLPNGTYIMSGGIDGNIYLGAGYSNRDGNYEAYGRAGANDLTFTVNGCNLRDDGAYLTTWLTVNRDVSSELTIYPMIRLASDSDDSYAQYAMTNRELTEAVTPVKGSFTYLGATWYYKVFKDYIVIGSEDAVSARMDASAWTTMATITELAGAFQYALNGMLFPNNGDVLKLNLQTTGELRYYRLKEGDRTGLYIQDNATLYDIRG